MRSSNIFQKICSFLKWLFSFFSKNRGAVAKGAGAAGAGLAAAGAGAGFWAKRVNKKALAMREEALLKYKNSTSETEAVMEKLGDLQIEMVSTFDSFIETMEKIQERPTGLKSKLSKVTLPSFKPEELKALSNDLQMALAGAGGTTVGLGVGAAAFGINTLALGPGALAGGVVLCVKGVSLSKKAIKNKREAARLKNDVEKICAYHSQLRSSAEMLYQSLMEVRKQYLTHLSALKELVAQKANGKQFSKEERLLVKNSITLVTLIHEMCKVKLVQKAANDNSIETVCEKDVKRAIASAKANLRTVKPIPQTVAV